MSEPKRFRRGTTKGNVEADYAKLRSGLTSINPVAAATLKNAVAKNGRSPEQDELNPQHTVNTQKLERLSNIISNNINAVTDLRQITPYIDKAEIIWSTLILYPNGRQDKILTYGTQNSALRNDKLHAELLKTWDTYFTNDYKIEKQLRKMLNDILWNTGSYCVLNLSRPQLDYMINGAELKGVQGTEEYQKEAEEELHKHFVKKNEGYVMRNLGKFIRNPKSTVASVTGIESLFRSSPVIEEEEFPVFQFDDAELGENKQNPFRFCTFTDNPAILFLQRVNEATRRRDVSAVTGIESFDSLVGEAMDGKDDIEEEEEVVDEKDKDKKDKKDKKEKNDKKGKPGVDFVPEKTNKKGVNAQTQNLSMAQQEALQNNIFRNRNPAYQHVQFVKTSDSLSVAPFGSAIRFHVPSEAVIPIHYNGNSGEQLDYILLLDGEGNFLKNTNDFEYYQSSSSNIANKPKVGSENNLISSLRRVQEGNPCDFDMSDFADMAKASIIKNWTSSILSGKSDSISISLDAETNKIWLARMLKCQAVRCLYVPGECITYMNFKRENRLGTGQSLTQLAKMHIARLAAFDLADALANIEGAQPHSLLSINLEKEDVDPHQSIAMARASYFRNNPRLHGILATAQLSVPQIVDALREQSLTVKVNPGENTNFAAPDVEINQVDKTNFKPVDDNSRQKVLNDIANYFGLPRSWLDVSDDQNNFQVEALAEHQMLLNQTVNWQEMFAEFIIDTEKKYAVITAPLMLKLIKIIKDNKPLWKPDSGEDFEGTDRQKINLLLADFINNIYCEFPTPTSTETTTKLQDALTAVNDLVAKWDEMSGTGAIMENIIKAMGIESEKYTSEEIKSLVKSVFVYEAFKRYNLPMPFDEIVGDGKNGGMASLVNSVSFLRTNTSEFLTKLITENVKADKKLAAAGARINKLMNPEPEPEETDEIPPENTDGAGDTTFTSDDTTDPSLATDDDNPFKDPLNDDPSLDDNTDEDVKTDDETKTDENADDVNKDESADQTDDEQAEE